MSLENNIHENIYHAVKWHGNVMKKRKERNGGEERWKKDIWKGW